MDAGYRVHLANASAIKNTWGSSTAEMLPMRPILRTCCAWGCWPRATSIRVSSVALGIWRASAYNWCATAPRILSIEGILMRQTGARIKSESVKGRTPEQVEEFGFAPD